MIPIEHYLLLSAVLFFIGVYGFIARKNLLAMLISIELMLNAAELNFSVFNRYMYPEQMEGMFFALFGIAIAAAETAIANASSEGSPSKDFTTLYEGINMTEKRLLTQLENRWGLKRYDSAGKPFDPTLHEALMMEKSADVNEATVQEEWSKGYSLKDRVIRTAKVKVLMPDGTAGNSAAENENTASGVPANGNSGAGASE
jgi:NADH:ubiquinone oxidoreductase subunit K